MPHTGDRHEEGERDASGSTRRACRACEADEGEVRDVRSRDDFREAADGPGDVLQDEMDHDPDDDRSQDGDRCRDRSLDDGCFRGLVRKDLR